jgi:hypothetical protein
MVGTRVLVAFKASHRVYQDAIAEAIRERRPHIEVMTAGPEEFEAEMGRFDPHLVICSLPNTVPPNPRPAWVEFFSLDPELLAAICLDGEYYELDNPGLDELLSVVDEAGRLAQTKAELGNC